MTEWLSIKEAPKDGNPILGVDRYGRINIYEWDKQPYHKKPNPYWKILWCHQASVSRHAQPIMWMPIPEPPHHTSTGEAK